MAEDTSGIERESPALESLYPEAKPAVTASTRRTENAGFVPKCIADQKYPIAATVVFTIMTITIIALAVRKPPPCPPTPPPIDAACPDSWIGYEGKCYYWSDQENNWNISKENCSSFSASLAMLDSEEELMLNSTGDRMEPCGTPQAISSLEEQQASSSGTSLRVFLMRFTYTHHYWIGLSKDAGKPWRWLNGTALNNQFPVRGAGPCVYINSIGLSSTMCSMEKNFLCSKKDACIRRKQRD
ncbi:C-type lectin domain family 2 member D [Varanus komodoensis]|nr:C-type lectin domain family 2 member D [Varanus komodoensis]